MTTATKVRLEITDAEFTRMGAQPDGDACKYIREALEARIEKAAQHYANQAYRWLSGGSASYELSLVTDASAYAFWDTMPVSYESFYAYFLARFTAILSSRWDFDHTPAGSAPFMKIVVTRGGRPSVPTATASLRHPFPFEVVSA